MLELLQQSCKPFKQTFQANPSSQPLFLFWEPALLLQVERLDDGSSTMQQLPRRPSDNFEVEQGTAALLARPAEVPLEDVDNVQGPNLSAAGDWSSQLVKVSGSPV